MTSKIPAVRKLRPDTKVYTLRGRSDEYGFWFSEDISKWVGGKKSSAERAADYRRRKKAGEPIKTRNHDRTKSLR